MSISREIAALIDGFAIPKHKFTALIELPGRPAAEMTLFLGNSAESHSGPERPSDLLNKSETFLPAIGEDGAFTLLNRDTLRIVSVSIEDEYGETPSPIPGSDTVAAVELVLDDGARVSGEVRYQMPEARRRIQDYLNTQPRFVGVLKDGVIRFVNRHCIARVGLIDQMSGTQ